MKNKTFLALFAIFLIAGSVACAYAAEATFDSIKFTVPDDFKVDSSNNTTVVLKDGDKEIIVTMDIVGQDAVNSFLSDKGFTFVDTSKCNTTITGTNSGNYSYDLNTYTKTGAGAAAYLLVKNNKDYSVILINNDVDVDDDFKTSDAIEAAEEIVKAIMLA